jgi:rhodanese-related sulfurtransferase
MGVFSISPQALYARMGTADAPLVFDVCKCEDYDQLPRLIPGARWRDHQRSADWAAEIPRGHNPAGPGAVLSCVKGLKVSQAAAAELRSRGLDVAILEGGSLGWVKGGFPTVKKFSNRPTAIGNRNGLASRWVTRVRPKIDRIACPWLISRFLDPAAKFFYVGADQVINAALELDAIPYDVDGVEMTHRNQRGVDTCSFDTLISHYDIHDPALDRVATIARGADTARLDLAPEAAGLLAISLGNSRMAGPDDHVALERGMAVYDALYTWARFSSGETHDWPSPKPAV